MKASDLNLSNLAELLSELDGRSTVPSIWDEVLPYPARTEAYQRLAASLGARYRQCSFANYEVSERKSSPGEERPSQAAVLKAVKEFCEAMPTWVCSGGGLLLYGAPGTGKDHLMIASLYWAILKHGYKAHWVDGLALYQQARDRIKQESEERDFVARYTISPILAISDPIPPVGAASAYSVDLLQRIIDRRYRDMKSTWVTINCAGAEAADRLASPLVDRLRHGSLCLQCDWSSYRSL